MQYVYAGLIVFGLIALFIVSYVLNSKTKRPEGCENLDEHCSACNIKSCARNTNRREK